MNFYLDTANIEIIKNVYDYMPIKGITTNPSILKKEGPINLFPHLKEIRRIIGDVSELHVQVTAESYKDMLLEAETILSKVDEKVFIKIPTTKNGIKVMKELRNNNINVTATSIYTKFQGYLALSAEVNYLAPYYNRMENLNTDAEDVLINLAIVIERTKSNTEILAASFRNISQINKAFEAGAHNVTINPDFLEQEFSNPILNKAIKDFVDDWSSVYGQNQRIYDFE